MITLSTGMILALLISGGITSLAMLSVFANVIGHETQLHDLRNRVKDLRFQHAMYLARINGQIDEDQEESEAEAIETKESKEPQVSSSETNTNGSELGSTVHTQAQSMPARNEPVAVAA